jgi:hypothetical protein
MSQPILSRLVSQLTSKGVSDPEGVAKRHLTRSGILDASGELTNHGRLREQMGAAERAKDRAAKQSGKHHAHEYKYDPMTNRARLR